MTNRRVHILGGGGGIGRWFIEYVFRNQDGIFCYDVNPKPLTSLPQNVLPVVVESVARYADFSSNFSNGDWFLLAVPEREVEPVLSSLGPVVPENSLVVAFDSIQVRPANLAKSYLPNNVHYLGCHPLFGPSLSSPVGQICTLVGYQALNGQHAEFRSYLTDAGLLTSDATPEVHDQAMSIVQALTHFVLFAFAKTVANSGIGTEDLLSMRTPNFQLLYGNASRVLKLASSTTGAIQSTTDASNARELFLNAAKALHDELKGAIAFDAFAKVIDELRAPLSGSVVDEGAATATIAVDSLQRCEDLLHGYKASGKLFVFRHRLSRSVHVVRIKDIRPEQVHYEECSKTLSFDGREYTAVGLTSTARKNYARCGIQFGAIQTACIKKRNIHFLTDDERRSFIREKLLPATLDLNVLNPLNLDDSFFENGIPRLLDEVFGCEFLHSFRLKNQPTKVTLRLKYDPDVESVRIAGLIRSVSSNLASLAPNIAPFISIWKSRGQSDLATDQNSVQSQ